MKFWTSDNILKLYSYSTNEHEANKGFSQNIKMIESGNKGRGHWLVIEYRRNHNITTTARYIPLSRFILTLKEQI